MPAHVVSRTTSKGERRYHVRASLGGRREHGGRVLHLGSFRTKREAEACVKWANLELAAARIPDRRAFLVAQLEATGTLRDTAEAWLRSRRDLAESTRVIYATHIQRGAASRLPLWDYPAGRITVADVLAFVEGLVGAQAAPASMRNYLSMVRQTLDYAGVDPNPTRDRRVKLPSAERHQPDPPTSREVALILEHTTKRYRLVIALLEATGLRVSELVGLAWGDVDLAESRFRIARGKTKAARRFVSVPHELMEHVAALCPLEDRRADRRVFRVERGAVANAMARACRNAGIPVYSPHDLRHRHASLRIARGESVLVVARDLGHSRASMTSDTYGHVVVDEVEAWRHADLS
jgi:integrase